MSKESSGSQGSGYYETPVISPDASDYAIDRKSDPKSLARATVMQFLELTPESLITARQSDEIAFSADTKTALSPNQTLAIAMYNLESTITTLAGFDNDRSRSIQSTWSIIDAETGALTIQDFSGHKAGSDFGTSLHCTLHHDNDHSYATSPAFTVLLSSTHYLDNVLLLGDPHEPVFFASKPDDVSPEWSSEEDTWLVGGGRTERFFDGSLLDDWYARGCVGEEPTTVWRRDSIMYYPLYNRDATGLEGYLEITQKLLNMFLQAIEESDKTRNALVS